MLGSRSASAAASGAPCLALRCSVPLFHVKHREQRRRHLLPAAGTPVAHPHPRAHGHAHARSTPAQSAPPPRPRRAHPTPPPTPPPTPSSPHASGTPSSAHASAHAQAQAGPTVCRRRARDAARHTSLAHSVLTGRAQSPAPLWRYVAHWLPPLSHRTAQSAREPRRHDAHRGGAAVSSGQSGRCIQCGFNGRVPLSRGASSTRGAGSRSTRRAGSTWNIAASSTGGWPRCVDDAMPPGPWPRLAGPRVPQACTLMARGVASAAVFSGSRSGRQSAAPAACFTWNDAPARLNTSSAQGWQAAISARPPTLISPIPGRDALERSSSAARLLVWSKRPRSHQRGPPGLHMRWPTTWLTTRIGVSRMTPRPRR